MTNVESSASPPHPRDVRALRVRLGAPIYAMARAAGYQTKRSWWLVEEGSVELAPWRWQLVLEAAGRGELARSEVAAGKTRQNVQVSVDEMLWVTEERRLDVAQAIESLMYVFELSSNELAEKSGVTHRMLGLVLGGRSRKQMTSKRIASIEAALLEMKRQAGDARLAFDREVRLSTEALRELCTGARVSQECAGRWAAPNSVSPAALMSAYECGTVRMTNESATRLADQLLMHCQVVNSHPAWAVLADPAGQASSKK
ncbi:hypothetical protein [Scleromatobacter humisilvae]|uniref:Uncharacterized protein n=1 Tax=Scleromatobacter humisilvae TaxID=2897159 RepID=A0A9X1YJF6_9BURK|nr:hypothetical protein [Scleromatobacter humisilvae]MCK9687263.1 hypothetical protein [Scleromatobacter humisilvae]